MRQVEAKLKGRRVGIKTLSLSPKAPTSIHTGCTRARGTHMQSGYVPLVTVALSYRVAHRYSASATLSLVGADAACPNRGCPHRSMSVHVRPCPSTSVQIGSGLVHAVPAYGDTSFDRVTKVLCLFIHGYNT